MIEVRVIALEKPNASINAEIKDMKRSVCSSSNRACAQTRFIIVAMKTIASLLVEARRKNDDVFVVSIDVCQHIYRTTLYLFSIVVVLHYGTDVNKDCCERF